MKSTHLRLPKTITASVCTGLMALALADGQRSLRAQLLLGKPVAPSDVSTGVSYSGRATVVNAANIHNQSFPGPIVICDTGPLPSSGGFLETSVTESNVANGALMLELGRASVSGDGSATASASAMQNFVLFINTSAGIQTLRANCVSADATAFCRSSGGVDVSGSIRIEGLVLNGEAIAIGRRLNQVVYFPGGRLIINEQASSVGGSSAEITVVPFRVVVDGCMNAAFCQVRAGITCAPGSVPPPPSDCGKLTGGGWIVGTPSGAKGNFGVGGGIRRGQFWGHLNYIDHGTGMHVHATQTTGFSIDPSDPDCRIMTYDVTIDGAAGTATVRACDKAEPGRDDIFEITLSNGYHAGGDLGGNDPGGGNIQLHKCPPGWAK